MKVPRAYLLALLAEWCRCWAPDLHLCHMCLQAITSLNLSANEIEDAAVAQIGTVLQRCPTKRTVDLSGQNKPSGRS